MMAFEQTRDVLEHLQVFHKEVSDFYKQLNKKAEEQRVKMLLDYMSRLEMYRMELLAEYKADVSKKVLDTWFQYTSEKSVAECLREIKFESNMSVNDVVNIVMYLDDCLLECYEGMAESAVCEEVKETFTNLLEMAKQEKLNHVKSALTLNDI